MSNELSLDGILKTKQWETDISHIISRHIQTIFNTKWKLLDQITEWRNTMNKWIEEYATQQKEFLEQHYAKKLTSLNTLRDKMLQQASTHQENKEIEQINQLVSQCDNLKVELAFMVPMTRPIPSFQLVTDEPQEPAKEIIDNPEQKIIDSPPLSEQSTPPPPPTE